ncbi:DUF427 domain-containing protein [Monashia sp. NPDC004114]
MAIDLTHQWRSQLADARFTPTRKRLRASREGNLVCDTADAVIVWLPRRVVPEYAVPRASFVADVPGSARGLEAHGLPDHVLLPFGDFDWLEEDEPIIGHPHDPFARIDILRSARHVRVELDGLVLADTHHPTALFETHLPPRWYIPMNDVNTEVLTPTDTRTTCAYKGHASYYSAPGNAGVDIAWVYRQPLREAEAVRDQLSFYAERTDTLVDGVKDPGFVGGMPQH